MSGVGYRLIAFTLFQISKQRDCTYFGAFLHVFVNIVFLAHIILDLIYFLENFGKHFSVFVLCSFVHVLALTSLVYALRRTGSNWVSCCTL